MEYNPIEYEKALNSGREYLLRQAGLSTRQLKYDMDYVWNIFIPEQQGAYCACSIFVEEYFASNETNENNGIILVGAVGCGKTMFASYIIHRLIHGGYSVSELREFSMDYYSDYNYSLNALAFDNQSKYIMLNTSSFLSELRVYTGIESHQTYSKIMYKVTRADVLIFDDLGTEKSTEWTQSVLFEIIDYRYNYNLPIIITTNCLPEELKEKIGERSVDRLREMCKLVTINHGSFRQTAK